MGRAEGGGVTGFSVGNSSIDQLGRNDGFEVGAVVGARDGALLGIFEGFAEGCRDG